MPGCALVLLLMFHIIIINFKESCTDRQEAAEDRLRGAMTAAVSAPSDVPSENGKVSAALLARLAQEDLQDIEVILRHRGVRTLAALGVLGSNDRAVLLHKARAFYVLLGLFGGNLQNALQRIFENVGHAMPLPAPHYTIPHQPGSLSVLNWQPRASGGNSSNGTSSRTTAPLGLPTAGLLGAVVNELPDPAHDDSKLMHDLKVALDKARDLIGPDRFAEVIRRLRRSDDLVSAGCVEAAEALAALGMRKEDVISRDAKELLKAAKKEVRDVLLWRCCGNALGLDSREALVRAFEEACRHTNCDENTVSQLTNGYRRVKEELGGGPPPRTRTAAVSPQRTGFGRNRPQSSRPDAQHIQGDLQIIPQDVSVHSVAAQAMGQRTMFDTTSLVRAPGALNVRASSCSHIGSQRGLAFPSVPEEAESVLQNISTLARMRSLSSSRRIVLTFPPSGNDFALPKANGRVAVVLVECLLKELEQSGPEFIGPCATWLQQFLAGGAQLDQPGLLLKVKNDLTATLHRPGVPEQDMRHVLQALVLFAGLDMPFLPNLLEGPDVACLVLLLSEIWSSYVATAVTEKVQYARMLDLVGFTTNLTIVAKLPFHVAGACCRSLGSLACMCDHYGLHRSSAEWLLEIIVKCSGHDDIAHDGVSALLEICKQRRELLGLDISIDITPENREAISPHIRDGVMGLVRTFADRKTLSDETMQKLIALLARTHSLGEVVRHLPTSKDFPPSQLLHYMLDEIACTLTPAISEWSKTAASRSRLAPEQAQSQAAILASDVLTKFQGHAGIGAMTHFAMGEQLLVEWAIGRANVRDSFFLLALLFGIRVVLPYLPLVSSNPDFFVSACRAVLDLNCLQPLDEASRMESACGILNITPPHSSTSRAAWAAVIGMALRGWAKSENDQEQELATTAGTKILQSRKRETGKEGWTEFLYEATSALNSLFDGSSRTSTQPNLSLQLQVQEAVVKLKTTFLMEVNVVSQADMFLTNFAAVTE